MVLKMGILYSPRDLPADFLFGKLVGVERDDVELRRVTSIAVEEVRLEEVFEDDVGVRAVRELGEDGRDLGPARAWRLSVRPADSAVQGPAPNRQGRLAQKFGGWSDGLGDGSISIR